MTNLAGDAELRVFTAALDGWSKLLPDRQMALAKNVAVLVAENLVVGGAYGPGTPIDTSFARNSWYMSINNPGDPVEAELDGSGHAAVTAMTMVILGAPPGSVLYILNGAVYIRRLEYGWSKQAPSGMVRIVLANSQTLVNEVVATMKARGVL